MFESVLQEHVRMMKYNFFLQFLYSKIVGVFDSL